MAEALTFAMAGGGTGGHVIPALAVARELLSLGHHPFFIGTRTGMESRLVPEAGFPIEWIDIGQFNRVDAMTRLRTLVRLPLSVLTALRILRRRRVRAVFSMGGYVAAPVVLAAVLAGVPVVAMEPNALPGMVNRRLGRLVTRALISFPESAKFFPPGRSNLTGVPVRREFFEVGAPPQGSPFTVLVTGGSRGSHSLNKATRDAWPLTGNTRIRWILQCGREQEAALAKDFAATGLQGRVSAFLDDMPQAFAEANLIVCRAGASTVAELAAAGKPAILVPFPYAADDHQLKNAEALVKAGAARLIRDSELDGQKLADEIVSLASNPQNLASLGEAIKAFAKPDASQRAASVLVEVALR
jgi:UDP-N-acetylglucosamine--N-acetylmuramyl-(pentapeptide) pyrophosphoryl-undecaprenol N-acetylglucosamine transferase